MASSCEKAVSLCNVKSSNNDHFLCSPFQQQVNDSLEKKRRKVVFLCKDLKEKKVKIQKS